MKFITIQDALSQAPFRPFHLLLDGGRAVLVGHQECILFNEPKTVCVVAEGEHIRVMDMEHISALTYENFPKAKGRK